MGNSNEAEALFATKRKQQQEQEAERARLEELERQKQEMADTIKKLEIMKAEQEREKREKEEREARERQEREERERIEREEREKREAKEARSAERKAAVDTTIKAAGEKVDKAVTNITSKNYLLYGIVGFAAVLVIVIVIILVTKSGGSSDDKKTAEGTGTVEDVNAKTTDSLPDDGSFASRMSTDTWVKIDDPNMGGFSYKRPQSFEFNEDTGAWLYMASDSHALVTMIDYMPESEMSNGQTVEAEDIADLVMSGMDAGQYRYESLDDGSGYSYTTLYDDISDLGPGYNLTACFVKHIGGGYVTVLFVDSVSSESVDEYIPLGDLQYVYEKIANSVSVG